MDYTRVKSHGCFFSRGGGRGQVRHSIVSSVYSKLLIIPYRVGGVPEHYFKNKTAFPIAKKTFSITKLYFLAFNYAIFAFCVHRFEKSKTLFFGDQKRLFYINQCVHDRHHTI